MIVNRPGEASFAGIPTFAKLPLALEPADLAGVDVAILGAPMDETVSNRPGSRYGPRAIRQADEASGLPPSRPHMLLGVDPFAVLNVVDYGDAETVPGDTARSHDAIRQRVAEICAAGAIPVVLGGDHSIADPNMTAVADHHGPGTRRRDPLRRPRRHGRATSPASSARTARRCGSSSIAARFPAIASCRSACAASGPSLPSSRGCATSGSAGGRRTSSTSAASTCASPR